MNPQDSRVHVVCSIYPVYDFARNVGGDRIRVSCLVPPGAEPHGWEPSPRDMVELQKADLFVYCGAGMEQWVGKTTGILQEKGIALVDASEGIELIYGSASNEHAHEYGHHKEAKRANHTGNSIASPPGNDAAAVDPHVWVDPVNAMTMVDNIALGLAGVDPENKGYYEQNAQRYKGQLAALHSDFEKAMAGVKRREFVTSHASFGYLARRYGLVQVPLRGLSPEVEPTPARMAEVVELVREKGIRYIFFESLVSPKVSKVIAGETGAEVLVLNPVGGLTAEEMAAGKDYLSIMRENLENLVKALETGP